MRDTVGRLADILLIVLVFCLPFEFRAAPPRLTELQIVFVLFMAASAPRIISERRRLLANRVVAAAFLFLAIVWITALASANTANAVKAAARYTAGVGVVCGFLVSRTSKQLRDAWSIAAIAAAAYGLLDYFGFGFPALFRQMEFYIGDVRRLSGSFEYPNSAAAYYALSLPVVWTSMSGFRSRLAASALLWIALLLTFSRGGLIAVVAMTLVWAMRSRSYRPLGLAAVGIVLLTPLAIYKPSLLIRFAQHEPAALPDINAEYRLEYNRIREKPGVVTDMPVVIINTGKNTWRSTGGGPVSLSYHWYDTAAKKILETASLETPLPQDVRSKETVRLNARFQTPEAPGVYLLDWDLRYPEYNWFSVTNAVLPGVVEADIAPGADSWRGSGDLSVWFNPPGTKAPPATSDIPRTQLWHAALVLFAQHPFLGIGPDNYRLTYGRVLGFGQWNKEIHSNNLYLEILVGSGVFGLLAFMLCLARIPWRLLTDLPPAGVALVHGAFDFFLMTTPLYFAFWLFVGDASQAAKEGD